MIVDPTFKNFMIMDMMQRAQNTIEAVRGKADEVDVEKDELNKKGVKVDYKFNYDLENFLPILNKMTKKSEPKNNIKEKIIPSRHNKRYV